MAVQHIEFPKVTSSNLYIYLVLEDALLHIEGLDEETAESVRCLMDEVYLKLTAEDIKHLNKRGEIV
jgi:hypothetical protein